MTEQPMENEFHHLTATDELQFVNHNPTDFNAFKKFQEGLDERFENYEQEKLRKEVLANLHRWEAMLPPRWSNAVLSKIAPPADKAAREILELLKTHGKTSLFIKGPSGSGKTYLAYATARRFVGKNWATPSQIKIISEEALLGFAAAGFDGQARFNDILKKQYVLYIIDGVAARNVYSQKEKQLWEQLIDHIYSKSLNVIFTSTNTASLFANALSESSESKLDHLVSGKIITVKGKQKDVSLDEPKEKESDKIDLFKS